MKFTQADLEIACDELSMLAFWPKDARPAVMKLLAKICPHREALRFVVNELINRVNRWPGPAEVRGLLCTRYEPADGIDQWCSLPGYTAAEAEAKHDEKHQQLKHDGFLGEEARTFLRQIAPGSQQSKTGNATHWKHRNRSLCE